MAEVNTPPVCPLMVNKEAVSKLVLQHTKSKSRQESNDALATLTKKLGDLYSTYPALLPLRADCVTRVHSRQATTMSAHVLLPLAANSKSERDDINYKRNPRRL
jgi:hypothetical protein